MGNEVRNVATFHNPIFAIRNGQPVKILAVGEQEGKSPVYLEVDKNGVSTWQSTKDFRIIDSNALPYTEETLRTLTGSNR